MLWVLIRSSSAMSTHNICLRRNKKNKGTFEKQKCLVCSYGNAVIGYSKTIRAPFHDTSGPSCSKLNVVVSETRLPGPLNVTLKFLSWNMANTLIVFAKRHVSKLKIKTRK